MDLFLLLSSFSLFSPVFPLSHILMKKMVVDFSQTKDKDIKPEDFLIYRGIYLKDMENQGFDYEGRRISTEKLSKTFKLKGTRLCDDLLVYLRALCMHSFFATPGKQLKRGQVKPTQSKGNRAKSTAEHVGLFNKPADCFGVRKTHSETLFEHCDEAPEENRSKHR